MILNLDNNMQNCFLLDNRVYSMHNYPQRVIKIVILKKLKSHFKPFRIVSKRFPGNVSKRFETVVSKRFQLFRIVSKRFRAETFRNNSKQLFLIPMKQFG